MRKCPLISYREIRAPPSAVRSKVNISPLSFLLQQQLLTALPKAEAAFRMMPTAPEQPAPAATPHPQSAVVPATSVQMLVQLAAADSSVERRRKMAENAGRGLALLDRLDVEKQVRPAAIAPLDALCDWLETLEMPEDPQLAAVMQEIELRVKVELAKHELRV